MADISQIDTAVERTIAVQVATNTAITAAVSKADINWVNVGWLILLGLQIAWWLWKFLDKFRGIKEKG